MKSRTPTEAEKIRLLPLSIVRGSLNTIFGQLTFSAAVFALYLAELGLTKSQIGFLRALLPLAGILAPFISNIVGQFGYKRTFILFYGIRKWVIVLLIAAPAIAGRYPDPVLLIFVTVVIGLFALCRSIAETALYPWVREYVPDAVRGKYTAAVQIAGTFAGIFASAFAGRIIDASSSVRRFSTLYIVGCALGFAGVLLTLFVPGGAPQKKRTAASIRFSAMRNPNFRTFLIGLGLVTLAQVPLMSFVPLYLREVIGLGAGNVVYLDIGIMAGSLVFSFLWGWSADRYGSKAVITLSLVITAFLPPIWMVMKSFRPGLSEAVAFVVSFFFGAAQVGFYIGTTHLLYNRIVPAGKESAYLSVYYAAIGLFGGIGPLFAGKMIDLLGNNYNSLFISCLLLLVTALGMFRLVRFESDIPTRDFLRLFVYGNPFSALGLTIRFNGMLREEQRLHAAKRMGQTRSPMHAEELLEMFSDPSFSVRYEAVHSAARTPDDSRITAALIRMLEDPNHEIRVAAAWALGRSEGGSEVVVALQAVLDSGNLPLEAMASRSLGMLGDESSLAVFTKRLGETRYRDTVDAYVAAIGSLKHLDGLAPLIGMYDTICDPDEYAGTERELLVAISRIAGIESEYIKLRRRVHEPRNWDELLQAISGSLISVKRQLSSRIGRSTYKDMLQNIAGGVGAADGRELEARIRETVYSILPGGAADSGMSETMKPVMYLLRRHKDTANVELLLFSVACVVAVLQNSARSGTRCDPEYV